jgi:hypothetical protein
MVLLASRAVRHASLLTLTVLRESGRAGRQCCGEAATPPRGAPARAPGGWALHLSVPSRCERICYPYLHRSLRRSSTRVPYGPGAPPRPREGRGSARRPLPSRATAAATWRRSERPRSSRAHGTRTRARGTCRRRRSTLASLRGTVEAAKVLRCRGRPGHRHVPVRPRGTGLGRGGRLAHAEPPMLRSGGTAFLTFRSCSSLRCDRPT